MVAFVPRGPLVEDKDGEEEDDDEEAEKQEEPPGEEAQEEEAREEEEGRGGQDNVIQVQPKVVVIMSRVKRLLLKLKCDTLIIRYLNITIIVIVICVSVFN